MKTTVNEESPQIKKLPGSSLTLQWQLSIWTKRNQTVQTVCRSLCSNRENNDIWLESLLTADWMFFAEQG